MLSQSVKYIGTVQEDQDSTIVANMLAAFLFGICNFGTTVLKIQNYNQRAKLVSRQIFKIKKNLCLDATPVFNYNAVLLETIQLECI